MLRESAMNKLVVLDDVPSCDGVIKSVSILVSIPDGQSDTHLQGLTVTLVAYHYSTVMYRSELAGSLTMESPNITITRKAEGTVIKATFSPRQEERLHIEETLYNVGVILTGTEDLRLEWGLSNQQRSYNLMVESLDQLPTPLLPHTIDTRTPFVRFEVGAGRCNLRDAHTATKDELLNVMNKVVCLISVLCQTPLSGEDGVLYSKQCSHRVHPHAHTHTLYNTTTCTPSETSWLNIPNSRTAHHARHAYGSTVYVHCAYL